MESYSTNYDIDESLLNEILWVCNSDMDSESDHQIPAPKFLEENIVLVRAHEK